MERSISRVPATAPLREGHRGFVNGFQELDQRLTICWIAQGIDTAGACTPVGHVCEHIVKRWGVPAVQVRRSSTDREERRRVEAKPPLAPTMVVPTPRPSLKAAGSNVPTGDRNLTSCPPVMVSGGESGGV